ncbi:hypothetical protein EHM69_00935 [candidate division KSB1 bacterium]|nr:MAG: hypothetical protein EHM69_00935 [candidate division KSB1 bacterium]
MSLQNALNWSHLRPLRGSQQTAFEELCCQLASLEPFPAGTNFVRVGAPDGGVEGYALLQDGAEKAWQAKFFETPPDNGRWSQIDESVKTALDKHPNLTDYCICLPVDRPDARTSRARSFMERWNDHVQKWEGWACDKKMVVKFHYWGQSEILSRLALPVHVGKARLWFDKELFSDEWFRRRLNAVKVDVGPRYTPELNVNVSITEVFDALGKTPVYLKSLERSFKKFRKASYDVTNGYHTNPLAGTKEFADLVSACQTLTKLLEAVIKPDLVQSPWEDIASKAETVSDTGWQLHRTITDLDMGSQKDTEDSTKKLDYGYGRQLLSSLANAADDIYELASSDSSRAVNQRVLCLLGEAGTGKTHLLCDVADRRMREGIPTILLLGQQFAYQTNPWTTALQLLDYSGSTDEFLGALETYAIANGTRAMILVDALNEPGPENRMMWHKYMGSFLAQIAHYPHVTVATSIRSGYADEVVPEHLRKNGLLCVTHYGFSGIEFDATDVFYAHYKIMPSSVPVLNPEFSNPLYLKLFCETLNKAGLETMPSGVEGFTKLLFFFVDKLNDVLARPDRLDFDEKENIVRRAVDALVSIMIEHGRRWVVRDDAKSALASLLQSLGHSKSLFTQLIAEGLLSEDKIDNDGKHVDIVRFTYERLADHLIASRLLDQHLDANNPKSSFAKDMTLGSMVTDPNWCYRNSGLLDALSAQVPERTGRDLIALAPLSARQWKVVSSLVHSLVTRAPGSVTNETLRIISKFGTRQDSVDMRKALLTLSVVPKHPLNAEFLHDRLVSRQMAERDGSWTIPIHHLYDTQSPVDRLLRWAWSDRDQSHLSKESIFLGATTLSWFLTSSNRFLRDKATKALVCLLTPRLDLVQPLLERFENVNDPYVSERLYAVAYGCCMRRPQNVEVQNIAVYVYKQIFEKGTPPPCILLRDYARGIVERAFEVNPDLDICPLLIYPPYQSEWPSIPSEQNIEAIKKDHEKNGKMTPGFFGIYGSVMDFGDFARYVIGTNGHMSNWSASRLGTPVKILRHTQKISKKFDQWIIGSGMSLGSKLVHEEPNYFDLSQIQRFVIKRVLDLGWTSDRFGWFDDQVDQMSMRREANKVERIGKKYQWIALREILARISDNFEYIGDHFGSSQKEYQGPWQLTYGRDIDPSHVLKRGKPLNEDDDVTLWWMPDSFSDWRPELDDATWIHLGDNSPRVESFIEVSDPHDSNQWLCLYGSPGWQDAELEEARMRGREQRSLWYHILSRIVHKNDVDKFVKWAKTKSTFWGPVLDSPSEYHNVYLGEFFWSSCADFYQTEYYEHQGWEDLPDSNRLCPILQTTETYSNESGGYDCSTEAGFHIYIPCKWLIDNMSLLWNGEDGRFVSGSGDIVFKDPSGIGFGRSCLLARKDILIDFLDRTGYALVWVMFGGKEIVTGQHEKWPGRIEMSGIYSLKDGTIQGERWALLRTRDGEQQLSVPTRVSGKSANRRTRKDNRV